ncbi:MAG: ABC transporter ATP-binding protein [Burkholderiales bacterium]
MAESAVRASGVGKRYPGPGSPLRRLLQAVSGNDRGSTWALRDVSFDVARGEAFGIIGRNGSGKSTLLQILAGTLVPSEGEAWLRGRTGALLELGAGFHPEFSGRENVFFNAALYGISRREVQRRLGDILAFAEIGDYLDRPFKHYSSGMQVRLAMSVQLAIRPDILLIDEALAVGDYFFQQKCLARLRALQAEGITLLLVSHDLNQIRTLCPRALYLSAGRALYVGDSERAARFFYQEGYALPAASRGSTRDQQLLWQTDATARANGARLLQVRLLDGNGEPARQFRLGAAACLEIEFSNPAGLDLHLAVGLKNRHDQLITRLASFMLADQCAPGGERVRYNLQLDLLLEGGQYSLEVALGEQTGPNQLRRHDETPWLGPIEIHWDYTTHTAPFLGLSGLPAQGRFVSLEREAVTTP